jgi:hypothetical protein
LVPHEQHFQTLHLITPTQSGLLLLPLVETDEKEIRITIPTQGMASETISRFIEWVKVEATAQRSRLSEQEAWKLSEEIKSDWWTRNQSRFPEK